MRTAMVWATPSKRSWKFVDPTRSIGVEDQLPAGLSVSWRAATPERAEWA